MINVQTVRQYYYYYYFLIIIIIIIIIISAQHKRRTYTAANNRTSGRRVCVARELNESERPSQARLGRGMNGYHPITNNKINNSNKKQER